MFTTSCWWARMPCPRVPCSGGRHLRAVCEPHGNLRWGLLSWGNGGWEKRQLATRCQLPEVGQACCRGWQMDPSLGTWPLGGKSLTDEPLFSPLNCGDGAPGPPEASESDMIDEGEPRPRELGLRLLVGVGWFRSYLTLILKQHARSMQTQESLGTRD